MNYIRKLHWNYRDENIEKRIVVIGFAFQTIWGIEIAIRCTVTKVFRSSISVHNVSGPVVTWKGTTEIKCENKQDLNTGTDHSTELI